LVSKKDYSVDKLAIILSYIEPNYANKILSAVGDDKQIEVIKMLTEEKTGKQSDIEALNNELEKELECSLGGADKLSHIITTFNNEIKKMYLEKLESDQESYAKIRPLVLLFDDIVRLDDAEVKKLIGAVNLEVLAASIATGESDVSKKLTENLSGAAKAMVTQFIELKKELLSQSDIEETQTQSSKKRRRV
jgi:flagellar motor switch protein FliG